MVKQANGCLASAWARLAADVGDVNATLILEKEWECKIPEKVIEVGLLQKARFAHMSGKLWCGEFHLNVFRTNWN